MAKKKRSKITDQLQTAEICEAGSQVDNAVDASNDALDPETNAESMLESVPDDPKQIDMLNDKISQMQQLMSELNVAKSTIAELEAKVKQLQSDNDMLVMKLAEQAAASVQPQMPQPAVQAKVQSNNVQARAAMPKRVNYNQPNYTNNGYGTWH